MPLHLQTKEQEHVHWRERESDQDEICPDLAWTIAYQPEACHGRLTNIFQIKTKFSAL